MAAAVKTDVKYYVRMPSKYIYLKESDGNGAFFTKFSFNKSYFDKDKAIKLAAEYRCEVVEETTTTTTDIVEKIIT